MEAITQGALGLVQAMFDRFKCEKRKKKNRRKRRSSSDTLSVKRGGRTTRSPDHDVVSEARTSHDASDQTEAYGAEAHSLSPDRPLGADAREIASPVRFPIPMDVDSGVGATTREQDSSYDRLTYAEVVEGLNTSVFRPMLRRRPPV